MMGMKRTIKRMALDAPLLTPPLALMIKFKATLKTISKRMNHQNADREARLRYTNPFRNACLMASPKFTGPPSR